MNNGRELFILGTGGFAKEVGQLARKIDPQSKRWKKYIYVTRSPHNLGDQLPYGSIELMDEELLEIDREVDVVIATGYPYLRKNIALKFITNQAISFPNLIHPAVEIDAVFVNIGHGNIITQGVVVTCDINISNFNIFNWNVTIGHDTSIGSYNVINPGASVSGNVKVEDECLIGTGARILENLSISSGAIIGAGAVVVRSIEFPGTYTGIPAKLK
jgi:sugar O-acyltransferase (sialic acid O-acetyltransferase NeuD family)